MSASEWDASSGHTYTSINRHPREHFHTPKRTQDIHTPLYITQHLLAYIHFDAYILSQLPASFAQASSGRHPQVPRKLAGPWLSTFQNEHVHSTCKPFNARHLTTQFEFDLTFGPYTPNREVYTHAVRPLVRHIFDKGNATYVYIGEMVVWARARAN